MTEQEVIALLKSINLKIEAMQAQLNMFQEALQPSKEYENKEIIVKEEPQIEESISIEYEGRTYKKFKPCKYKCGLWTSWATDYKKGDKILHINPMTKEVIGFNCPKFAEGG